MQQEVSIHSLEKYLDRSPLAFFEVDSDFRVVFWSERARRLFGWSEAETLGRGPDEWSFLCPEETPKILETMRCVASGECSERAERAWITNKDGRQYECLWHAAVDPVAPGTLLAYVLVDDGFTKLKSRIEAIEYGLEVSNIGCWNWDLKTGRLEWLGNMERIFRYEAGTFNGTTERAGERIHPEDRAKISQEMRRCINARLDYSQSYRLVMPDGEIRWVHSAGRTTYSPSGDALRIVGTVTDITDKVREEEFLLTAKKSAESSSARKSAFLANMSHEIRTPLGVILGFAELLSDPDLTSEERSEYMKVISRNGAHLSTLIDDILDLSKVEAGRLDVMPNHFNLLAALNDVMQNLQSRAFEKGVRLNLDFNSQVPQQIYTDPVRFKQILTNLTNNAVKFTERGEVNVTVLCDSQSRELRIRVQDSGVGISASGQKSLFRPFMRADCLERRKYNGTGLGLALSRKIARALGGDLTLIRSAPGEGSTFEFKLPRHVYQSSSQSPSPRNDSAPAMEPAGYFKNNVLSGLSILLAEDSVDNQILVERIVKKHGARITIVSDGRAAIEKLASGVFFDLVLMDIQMPIMDGYDATRSIRESGNQVPIIALTAHAMKNERQKALDAGCSAHLPKPVRPRLLVETIRRMIKTRRETAH